MDIKGTKWFAVTEREKELIKEYLKEIDKIRESRAIEKEKLDRSAKRYTDEKKSLDKLLKTRSAQNEKLKNQQIAIQEKLKKLSS